MENSMEPNSNQQNKLKLVGAIIFLIISVVFMANSASQYFLQANLLAAIGSGGPTVYYVDSVAGLDTNTGTAIDKPWKTVAKVNATGLVAGDQVLFKRGGVWTETLTPAGSGTASQPITFGAYGSGNVPELSGGGTLNNVVRIDSKDNLILTDLALTNSKASEEASLFMIYGNNVKLQNLTIKNNGGVGIGGLGTTNLTISNNDINNNGRQGIYLAYASGSVIEKNKVYANCQQKDDAFGIDIIVPTGSNIVRYNTVHDQAIITNASLYVCGSSKCGNGGIRFDGDNGSDQRNTDMADNQAYRNLIYNEDQGVQLINFSSAEVFNNSIAGTRQYGILVMAQPGFGVNGKNKVQNNIVQVSTGPILASLNGVGNTIDYNVYYPTTGNNFIWTNNVNWSPSALTLVNFANWKTTSGLDAHSLNADPKFAGAPSNLDLQSASPAINIGSSLSAGLDFLGRSLVGAMDIGAYEYQGTVTPPTCTENWVISAWIPTTCTTGTQTRTITDSNNCGTTVNKPATTTTQTCTVPVVNRAPTSLAISSSRTGSRTFSLTGSATDPDGDTLTYNWNFGDNSTGTGKAISHRFSRSFRSYTVTLTVSDGKASAAKTKSIYSF